jgi:hypothetical protein
VHCRYLWNLIDEVFVTLPPQGNYSFIDIDEPGNPVAEVWYFDLLLK